MIIEIEIETDGLGFSYDSRTPALEDVTFEVTARRIGIVGQNGSGKTTLLSIFMGFLKPDKGEVMINGLVPFKERDKLLKMFAPAFEKGHLPYGMKVRELVTLIGEIVGDEKDVEDLAGELGLLSFKDKKVYELSSGQGQLLWIFNALADRNRVPVLDEPFVHLDIHAYKRVARVLKERFDSYILTSHIPEDVELLTESVIVLEDGRVWWHGSLPEVESTYEVFVPAGAKVGLPKVLADFGNVVVCECPEELLESLMRDGSILGYKRAGVRLLYAKIRS
ncbi:ABC transporter ATP-binding protein [Thermococcus sp.]|uniref:ATP-binding cassette domain-containing protein n=1 Tax=Thermococcus sp. TaxID=35749 RepID=UPI00261CFACB|nr:ABC transporter ATP-binding protein [Thermococcus sp.]